MTSKLPPIRLSIVLKVSLLAGSIAALASLIVGSIIVSDSSEIVYQNALNRLKYETNIKTIRLLADIKNLSGDALYLSGTPPIKGIMRSIANNDVDPFDNSSLSTWKNRLATIFTELIRAKPNYLQIRYIGLANQGKELVRVDRKGNQIKTIPDRELQNKDNTAYFEKSIQKNLGDVYLSDISLNREFGKISEPHTPVIRAATPIFYNNQIFGILVINMDFSIIFDNLVKNTPRTLTPYVTNENGFFLAHPDKERTYGFDFENEHTIQSVYKNINLKRNTDLRDVEYTLEGNGDVVHIVKAHFDPSQESRFIAVMLATSIDNLDAASIQLRYKSFMIMGLLVILSLLVAAYLASRLMRPLELISIAAENLAQGRKISNLPTDSKDEIGELARSFENMRCQLEDKQRELIVSQGHVHHANKMASLGEMASSMAHEINTPIQSINLIAQRVQRQLKKNLSNEEIHDSMKKITTSVAKVSEIINSLRNVSRDSTQDEFTDTPLRDLIGDAINMTEERFRVNNVDFNVKFHNVSENTVLQCQRLQISQVLINLVNNAYYAIKDLDNKWIEISIQKISNKIRFSVTDSGCGIPDEKLERIFEPMFTTKEVGNGTGLGLSISSDIVAQHYGLLYVDKESKNTCFIFEIPIIHTNNKKNLL